MTEDSGTYRLLVDVLNMMIELCKPDENGKYDQRYYDLQAKLTDVLLNKERIIIEMGDRLKEFS